MMMRPFVALLAQIIPVPDGASLGLTLVLLVVSVVVFATGAVLAFRGSRRLTARVGWLLGLSGLVLCASALLFWAWLGLMGKAVKRAFERPTRRSWDLSTGNEVTRLGERVVGLQSWGGALDFTIALPSERRLAGRARFVSIDSRDGRIQRLRWRSAPTRDPCPLLQETSRSLRLKIDPSATACRERVKDRDPRDPVSPAWTVCGAETEIPLIAAQILGAYDPQRPDLSLVEVTVVWDRRLRDPLVNLPTCPCDQGGVASCRIADLRGS